MRLASFDIGKKNFAFYIEEFDDRELEKIENLPMSERYNSDGTCTEDFQKIIQAVTSNGKTILHKNTDLTVNCNNNIKLDPESFFNMNKVLDLYHEEWEQCDYIIIEKQMSFGKKVNLMAIKLAQHCHSYFIMKYLRKHIIIEFEAFHKTQVLGAPKVEGKKYKSGKCRYKAMTPAARKKWAVNKCIEILKNREELETVEKMFLQGRKEGVGKTKTGKDKKGKLKLDDLADTLCQANAAKYLIFVDRSLQV